MDIASQLASITKKARHFAHLDVIDVNFKTGETREVYVAIDIADRARGLAGLTSLEVDGMMFVYPQTSVAAFTCRDMKIPIDICFYDSSGRSLGASLMTPAGYSLPIICDRPYSYVIEAPAGTLPSGDLSLNGR